MFLLLKEIRRNRILNFRWQLGVALARSSMQPDGSIRLERPYVSISFDVIGSDGVLRSQSAELSIPQFKVRCRCSRYEFPITVWIMIVFIIYRNSNRSLKKLHCKWTLCNEAFVISRDVCMYDVCMPSICNYALWSSSIGFYRLETENTGCQTQESNGNIKTLHIHTLSPIVIANLQLLLE